MSASASTTASGGISGPAWAVGYGLVVLAVLVGVIVTRRRLAAGPGSALPEELDRQPYAVAYLAGGPARVLMAVVGSMRVAGTIVAQGFEVCAEGQVNGNASELERAIHLLAAIPIRWDYLDADPTVSGQLDQLRCRLERAGLLLSTEQQRRIKHTGWWMVAVGVLGIPMLALAGVVAKGAVGNLLVFALFAAAVLVLHAPQLSQRGLAQLRALCARYAALDPQRRPDLSAHGPAYAALAVGLFGASALASMDAHFANLIAESFPPRKGWDLNDRRLRGSFGSGFWISQRRGG